MTSLGAVTLWSGWDVPARTPDRLVESFERSESHDPGMESRYELIAVAARGFRPPRFLSVIELGEDESSDPGEAQRGSQESYEGLRQTWSLQYRRVAETAPEEVLPYAIYLLGVNPPAEATNEELQVFNDFYTKVHLPEVAERRHALRAVRYELSREVTPPYQGPPRFLAVYELDEEAASMRRHVGPPYAPGPEVWQRHTTPWRLWYRRLRTEEGDPPDSGRAEQ